MLRQALELGVASEAQAREIHAELAEAFGPRLAEALGEMFDAACAEDTTMRIERVDLDLGVLPRDGLLDSLARRASERLAALVGAPGAAPAPEAVPEVTLRRLGVHEVMLERLAAFLASGALSGHEPRVTAAELQADLARLLDEAPQALMRRLLRLPAASTARRLAGQFSRGAVLRMTALAAGLPPVDLEALLEDWSTVEQWVTVREPVTVGRELPARRTRASARRAAEARRAAPRPSNPLASSRRFTENLLELLLESRPLGVALRVLVERLLARTNAVPGGAAELAGQASRRLPAASRIRQVIERAADALTSDPGLPVAGAEGGAAGGAAQSIEAAAAPARNALDAGFMLEPQRPEGSSDMSHEAVVEEWASVLVLPEEAHAIQELRRLLREAWPLQSAVRTTIKGLVEQRGSPGAAPAGAVRTPAALLDKAVRHLPGESQVRRAIEQAVRELESGPEHLPAPKEHRARKTDGQAMPWRDPPVAGDAFRGEYAGLVILWPFLAGYYEALGLASRRGFATEAARSRAVLLAAHLCDGGQEWGEAELLLGKILCGYPPFAPLETRLEPSDAERAESKALLASVINHWSALKGTSIDGLRSAFLRREGTLRAQAKGWKLEVARAAHDVLLDKLPWGFGLVLLPWMEQPLYVEW